MKKLFVSVGHFKRPLVSAFVLVFLGLNRGEAKISQYNTVITAEVDVNSSLNKGQPPAKLTLDLFREFRGFDTAGTFVQVSFPGMFPDLTRWQAEADQQKVKQGQDSW